MDCRLRRYGVSDSGDKKETRLSSGSVLLTFRGANRETPVPGSEEAEASTGNL
ncbi:MAG: hypothetical protein P8X74_19455 [Reinekea sp.]|jgi:hypothetical protein